MRAIILAIILGLCFSRSVNLQHADAEAQNSEATFVATKQRPQLVQTRNVVEPEHEDLKYKSDASDIDFVENSDDEEDAPSVPRGLASIGRSLNEKTHNLKTNNQNSHERKEKKYTNVQLNNNNGSNQQDEYFFFSADLRKGRRKALGRNEPEEEISEEFCEEKAQKNVEFRHISHKIDADGIVKKFLSF